MKNRLRKHKMIAFLSVVGFATALITQCINPGFFLKNQGLVLGALESVNALENLYKAYDREFSPKEEYFIGRSVSAYLMNEKRIILYNKKTKNSKLDDYINKIGHSLAKSSDRPGTYQGYRFTVIKSKRLNAYAVPSGFIYITTGLINLCESEDELAGVLAHEISHIVFKHPTKSIEELRRSKAVAALVHSSTMTYLSGKNLNVLTSMFGNMVDDVRKYVINGYDADKEKEADLAAVKIMIQTGYNPKSLSSIIRKLKGGGEIHGEPKVRAKDIDEEIANQAEKGRKIIKINNTRRTRFKKIIKNNLYKE